ncbi:MAG: type II toxin-antitoxin system VapC family toxin [Bacteroidia bacterium]|nr:type II toxin-antitoxin system VapC family toxin [Bacteroidia bacterium]
MNGNYLLDTNIVIALFDDDINVVNNIQNADSVYVPSIVIGELYYGAYNSVKQKENIEKINGFRNDASILNCDADTGNYYGKIKKGLKDKGNPIPENDIWIAALATQHDLELVSRDKHFEKIDNLKVTKW